MKVSRADALSSNVPLSSTSNNRHIVLVHDVFQLLPHLANLMNNNHYSMYAVHAMTNLSHCFDVNVMFTTPSRGVAEEDSITSHQMMFTVLTCSFSIVGRHAGK